MIKRGMLEYWWEKLIQAKLQGDSERELYCKGKYEQYAKKSIQKPYFQYEDKLKYFPMICLN